MASYLFLRDANANEGLIGQVRTGILVYDWLCTISGVYHTMLRCTLNSSYRYFGETAIRIES